MKRNPSLFPSALLILFFAVAATNTATAQPPTFFATPQPVSFCQGPVCNDRELTLTADELLVVFASDRTNPGSNTWDLWYATRPIPGAPWNTPQIVDGVNTSADERGPGLSPDGLELYFTRQPGFGGQSEMFVVQRPDRSAPWGQPNLLPPPINGSGLSVFDPQPTEDGLKLFFCSDEAGPIDIYTVERPATGAAWSNKQAVPSVNELGTNEIGPAPEANGSILWFSSDRAGGAGGYDIYMSWLQASTGTWTAPMAVVELNTPNNEAAAFISTSAVCYFNSFDLGGAPDFPRCICRKTPSLTTEGGANGYTEGQPDPNWPTPVTFAEGDNWATGTTAGLSMFEWLDPMDSLGFWGVFMSGARLPTSVPLPFVSVGAQELEPSSLTTLGFSGRGPFGYSSLNVVIPALPALAGLQVWLQAAFFNPSGDINLTQPRRISIL